MNFCSGDKMFSYTIDAMQELTDSVEAFQQALDTLANTFLDQNSLQECLEACNKVMLPLENFQPKITEFNHLRKDQRYATSRYDVPIQRNLPYQRRMR